MTKQLTLPIFENEKAEETFEFSHEAKSYVSCSLFGIPIGLGGTVDCYVRRGKKGQLERGNKKPNEEDYTFIHVASLNLLGQRSGTLFRFLTSEAKESQFKTHYDVIKPELQTMSKERIIEFIEDVVRRYATHDFKWDYNNRCKIYAPSV